MTNQIAQAGNTVVPALLASESSLGFQVAKIGDQVRASRAGDDFIAADPVAVLGLVKLIETRTWDWAASDSEIDETLRRFGEDG